VFDIDCGTGAGILLGTFSDGWEISGNHVHDMAASQKHWMSEGIRLAAASMYNTIDDNVVERLGGPGRGITTDMYSGWNVISDNRVTRADQGFSEEYGAWGNKWLRNVSRDNRQFGFNLYARGASLASPDELTPKFIRMSCNQSVSNPLGLNIGWSLASTYENNDFQSVRVGDTARSRWRVNDNTWDGDDQPPPAHPSDRRYQANCP
jgi:hypothetical protein